MVLPRWERHQRPHPPGSARHQGTRAWPTRPASSHQAWPPAPPRGRGVQILSMRTGGLERRQCSLSPRGGGRARTREGCCFASLAVPERATTASRGVDSGPGRRGLMQAGRMGYWPWLTGGVRSGVAGAGVLCGIHAPRMCGRGLLRGPLRVIAELAAPPCRESDETVTRGN